MKNEKENTKGIEISPAVHHTICFAFAGTGLIIHYEIENVIIRYVFLILFGIFILINLRLVYRMIRKFFSDEEDDDEEIKDEEVFEFLNDYKSFDTLSVLYLINFPALMTIFHILSARFHLLSDITLADGLYRATFFFSGIILTLFTVVIYLILSYVKKYGVPE